MRVAIVYFENNHRDKLVDITKGLSKGLESQGHMVDIIDGKRDVNTKLTAYDYLAVGTEKASLFGKKIPSNIASFFENAGMVTGKRCMGFILKSTIGASRALNVLMKSMEHEGLFLKNSMQIATAGEAEEVGKRLHVKKKEKLGSGR